MGEKLEPWKTICKEKILDVSPWFDVWREMVELPNGQTIPDFYTIGMPDVCAIVAIREDRKVIALEQYKHGVKDIVLNIPAGFLEKDEVALVGAKRELLEETGYVAHHWVNLGSYVRNANRGSGSMHMFLALDAHCVAEPDSGDLEDYAIQFIDFDVLLAALLNDKVKVMGIALAILLAHNYLKMQSNL